MPTCTSSEILMTRRYGWDIMVFKIDKLVGKCQLRYCVPFFVNTVTSSMQRARKIPTIKASKCAKTYKSKKKLNMAHKKLLSSLEDIYVGNCRNYWRTFFSPPFHTRAKMKVSFIRKANDYNISCPRSWDYRKWKNKKTPRISKMYK